jgi:hypothetical protein
MLLGCVAFAAACGVGASTRPAGGEVNSVALAVTLNLQVAVASAAVTVWRMDGTVLVQSRLEQAAAANGWALRLGSLPAPATYRFAIDGYDAAGTRIYQGESLADIVVGAETRIAIVIQSPAPPSQVNQLPVVTAVSASAMPIPSLGHASFTVQALSPQLLSFDWRDSCGGTFAAPAGATTSWTAPEFATPPAECIVVLTVSDGASSLTTYIPVTFQ